MKNQTKQCASCNKEFKIEPDDFGFYEQMKVPAPTWCPYCRMIRRLTWTGYRMLYKRKCEFTGEPIITAVHPSRPQKIYRQDIWWSDKWDPKEYARDYDFNKPFLEQWKELFETVPYPSLFSEYSTMVNSEYCNGASALKNCYLAFKIDFAEDCAYTNVVTRAKNSLDIAYSEDIELCYDVLNTRKCYQSFFSQDCRDCHDIYFSKDLAGCSNCIGSINLRNKQYCIFNEQYSKEEYEQKLKEFDFGSVENVKSFRKKAKEFFLKFPRKQFYGRNNVNSSGDYLINTKNVTDTYMASDAENLRYCQLLKTGPVANSRDYTQFGIQAEWIYESSWAGLNVNNLKFCAWNFGAHDLEYCFGCHNSENLLGCVGLRKAEYCIFNKQYTKEEYEELVPRIKKHMADMPYKDKLGREYKYGEMLPSEFAPWGYNATTTFEFFPISAQEAKEKGFNWDEEDEREYQDATTTPADHIKDIDESILKEILKCEDCGKNYQIIPMEFSFLQRFNLPVPRKCPLCRDRQRITKLNPIKDYDSECAKCHKEIRTSYSSDSPEIVYCEDCYNQEVV